MKKWYTYAAAALCLVLTACGQKEAQNRIQEPLTETHSQAEQDGLPAQDNAPGTGQDEASGSSQAAGSRPQQPKPQGSGFTAPKIGVQEYPRVDGSTATIPLSQGLYQLVTGASAQEAQAAVQHSKTTGAYLDLIYGRTDLVIAYAPGPMVQEESTRLGVNIRLVPIGRDALVFMANASNPVNSLTMQQLVDIYSGKTTNWAGVGGRDLKIEAFQRPENSGSQNLMSSLVMKDIPMAKAPQEYVSGEMGELIEDVAAYTNTGNALGYSVYYYARNMYQIPQLKFMAVDQVLPANETIRDGSYPYVNDFYVAVREDEPIDSRAYELFTWLASDNGQALVEELGYVGISATDKKLPAGWNGGGVPLQFTASLGLPGGTCILADGSQLYGSSGLAVLDDHMKLQYFINSVSCGQVNDMIQSPQNAVLALKDMQKDQYGLYSLERREWIIPPAYDNIFPADDGFILIVYNDGEGKGGLWGQCDSLGNVTLMRELREDDPTYEYDLEPYHNSWDFAENYPEILAKYGVTEEAVNVKSSEAYPSYVTISEGTFIHCYRADGTWILDLDTGGRWKEDEFYDYMYEVNDNLAYVEVYLKEGTEVYIYKNGALVKKLLCRKNEHISDVGENFYTKYMGNYIWVYNYQDESVARYLNGWLVDD